MLAAAAALAGEIPPGAKVYIFAPVNPALKPALIRAFAAKKVPVTVIEDRHAAEFWLEGFYLLYEGDPSWNGVTMSVWRWREMSVRVSSMKHPSDIIFRHKYVRKPLTGFKGIDSAAESVAKHLKEFIETGKQ